MARVYGGLCAGATSAKASIAASTWSSTRCTPVRLRACTALNPMADDLGSVGQHADLGVGQLVEAELDRVAVVGDRPDQLALAPLRLDDDLGRRGADPLDRPARQDRLGRVADVEEAILEAGGAQVGDEDLHRRRSSRERPDDGGVRAWDDVGGAELADLGGGLGAGLDGGAHAADVAADHHAHDPAVELDDRAGELDASPP